MMQYTRMERTLQLILANALVILAGMFVIYYSECRINAVSREMAAHAATEIARDGFTSGAENVLTDSASGSEIVRNDSTSQNEITGNDSASQNETAQNVSAPRLTDTEQYLTYSVFLAEDDGTATLHLYYGQQTVDFAPYFRACKEYYESQKSFYVVRCFVRFGEAVSLAGSPIIRGGRFAGFVYVCRRLEYMYLLWFIYALVSTVLFYLIALTVHYQRKSRERIEEIYHKYIANISHELKSPVASISAIAETLSEGFAEDEATRSRYYGIMLRESKLLEHSVLQIIELSKYQDGQLAFVKKRVTTHQLLDLVCERFSDRCEEIGITFWVDESVWELPVLYTDPARMQELFNILLDNAYKFVADDGKIFIDATSKFGQATLRVNDNGRGISAEDMPHVFERFYKTTVDNPTGSGLGLAIAKEITGGLGEEIWAQSEEGKGTIFFVTVATVHDRS